MDATMVAAPSIVRQLKPCQKPVSPAPPPFTNQAVLELIKLQLVEHRKMHCDGAIRNIEKEISRECTNRSIPIEENFLNYYLKLLSLDPSWGISDHDTVDRLDVQNFIQYVVTQLEHQTTPNLITLKMQFYFMCNFHQKKKIVKRNRTELLARLKNLEKEIVELKTIEDDEEIETMYRRLVFYITLASGLGNPSVDAVYKEVRAALGSILDKNEIKEFIDQPRYVKSENLLEFTQLVTGIRLFNKDCGKGGEGMEDLPKLIHEALDEVRNELQSALVRNMDTVNLITTALDYVFFTELDERNNFVVNCHTPKGVTSEDVDFIKGCLVVFRQYELYLRKLIDELEKIDQYTTQIFLNLQRALIELHRVVKHRIAIPVNQVFPYFIKLSEVWNCFQDQTVLLAKNHQITNTLQKYIKILNFPDSLAEMMIPPNEHPLTDAQRMLRSTGLKIPPEYLDVEVLECNKNTDLQKLNLEYLGFCAWKLFMTDGALLPGNPNLGVLQTMNMTFACSTVNAGIAFGTAPQKCVMEVINLARRKPELINLLNIRSRMILVQNIKELYKEPPVLPLTEEVDVQTELHPMETNIDRSYSSNVWDLKRQALLFADLMHRKTVSCQTTKSYYIGNARVMACGTREKKMQTRKDEGTNVPKPSTFFYGLRGRKDDKQFKIDLTRPVEE